MSDTTDRAATRSAHTPSAADGGPNGSKRPYRKPTLRSTKAFERLALLSCPGASESEGDCDEL